MDQPTASTASRPRRPPSRWWAVLGLSIALTLVLSGVAAALISKAMWGYFFFRPAPHDRVLSARNVVSVTPLEQRQQRDGSWAIVPTGASYDGPGWYEQEKAAYPQEFDYYLLDRRPLRFLELRGVATAPVPGLSVEELPDLVAMLQPVLAAEAPGFDQTLDDPSSGRPMNGTLYELVGARGESLMLLAIRGCAVSNDHYPYFELLYEEQPDGELALISTSRFYFDLAGLEGIEFPRIFVALSVLELAVVVPVVGGSLLYRRFSSWGAVRRGVCPQCRYNLMGSFGSGCPECGWGRGEGVSVQQALRSHTPAASIGRLLSRPPSWTTFALVLAGSWMVLLGWSTPGREPRWVQLGILVWLLAGALMVAKLIGWAVAAGRGDSPRSRLRWLRVLAVPVIVALTAWATASDAALRWRFRLSRPAMDRLVAGMPYAPGTMPERAGLYRVYGVHTSGQGVFVGVPGLSLHYCNGFVCFPGGKPGQPVGYGKPIECTPLGDEWYLWRYVDP